jgi:predicted branched-subunit amino acid permease
MTAAATDVPARLTGGGVARGIRLALPFGASSLIYGLAFGLMSAQIGMSALESVVMSALVFSGTAQIAILQSWTVIGSLLPLFLTVLVVNARYLLMGAALRPWLGTLSAWKSHLTLFFLVDGAFALCMREHAKGERDAGILLGSGALSYTGWVVGTAGGFIFGALVSNPHALGLDFVIVAFAASSAAFLWRGRIELAPALTAIAAVVAGEYVAPGAWVIVVAGLAAAFVGAIAHGR